MDGMNPLEEPSQAGAKRELIAGSGAREVNPE